MLAHVTLHVRVADVLTTAPGIVGSIESARMPRPSSPSSSSLSQLFIYKLLVLWRIWEGIKLRQEERLDYVMGNSRDLIFEHDKQMPPPLHVSTAIPFSFNGLQ